MIEFKAECGHTVRAKDEDAGGVVRCSYCGRKSSVPENRDDELDFLFKDVGGTDQLSLVGSRVKRPRRWFFVRRPRRPRKFDPFAVALRMCYAALLLIIVIVVAKKYVAPLFKDGGLAGLVGGDEARPAASGESQTAPAEQDSRQRMGLLARTCPRGLFIDSVPIGADVYCIDVAKTPNKGSIRLQSDAIHNRVGTDGTCFPVGPGTYWVEVVFKLSDPRLFDPKLPYFEGYRAFRKSVEDSPDAACQTLLEDYFVPDDADQVFADKTDGLIYIVRQYRDVLVRRDRPTSVRALFLPKIMPGGSSEFSIAKLVTDYIPKCKAYNFEESYVRFELEYQGVQKADLFLVIEALYRIGIIPYVTAERETKLFGIGIDDGELSTKVIREARE